MTGDKVEDNEVERTEDGRYLVINDRRWRASDPAIPARLRQELVDELMTARRLVKTRDPLARPRVHDAKVALGERGEPWWEPTPGGRAERLEATMKALLRHREGTTICPSDAARVVGGEQWRDLMGPAREVAFTLAEAGVVQVLQRGEPVEQDGLRGPVRIARGERFEAG